jgi:hypothetical protein
MQRSWTNKAVWNLKSKKLRKWCNFVSPFLFNKSYGLRVLTIDTKCPNQLFYVRLVDLHTISAKQGLETYPLQIMIFEYVCSTWSIVELKTRFETWKTRNALNGVSLFNVSYLITHMGYLCSQRTRNVQIKYFMFDWSIYTLFVLNRGWKRDSLQIMMFVNVCSTWSVVQIKTSFVTWITWNVVNGVSLFHLSYLILIMEYLCS